MIYTVGETEVCNVVRDIELESLKKNSDTEYLVVYIDKVEDLSVDVVKAAKILARGDNIVYVLQPKKTVVPAKAAVSLEI